MTQAETLPDEVVLSARPAPKKHRQSTAFSRQRLGAVIGQGMQPGAGVFSITFLVTLGAHLLIRYLAGIYPFGDKTGAIGDFATQYYPFYSRFRESLVSGDFGSLFFAWDLGLGVASLSDYATYLAGPFTFLILLVPPHQILAGMTLIILVKLAVAAGTMRLLLRRLNPELPGLLALALSVGYGTNAWALEQGQIALQWLDALYGVPLLCLVALAARGARGGVGRWWWGAGAVALVWWSNYYVAAMVSLLAGLFACAYAAGMDQWRDALKNVWRFFGMGLLGVSLAAPILLPTAWSVILGVGLKTSAELPLTNQADVAVRLLPFTYDVYDTPMLYSGVVTVLLAASFWLRRELGWRLRLSWTLATLFIVGALFFRPLLSMWNLFQTPHGSAFRWVFVISAWLVITAGLAWRGGLNSLQLLLIVILSVAAIWFRYSFQEHDYLVVGELPQTAAVLAGEAFLLVLAAIPLWVRRDKSGNTGEAGAGISWKIRSGQVAHRVALLGLAAVVFFEGVGNGVFVAQSIRSGFFAEIQIDPVLERSVQNEVAQATKQNWPRYRILAEPSTEPFRGYRNNLSARYHYPGTDYYSTTVSREYAQTVINLGFTFSSGGRFTSIPPDTVLANLLGAMSRDQQRQVFPMVRLDSSGQTALPDPNLPTAYRNRAELANVEGLYEFPPLRISKAGHELTGAGLLAAGQEYEVSLSCAPGTTVFAAPTWFDAISWAAFPYEVTQREGLVYREQGIFGEIGTATAESQIFGLRLLSDLVLEENFHIACVSLEALQAAQQQQRVPDQMDLGRWGTVQAYFEQPVSGEIVVATPAVSGWQCQVDGSATPIEPRGGLLSVQMNHNQQLNCVYRPPLWRLGWGMFAVALGVLLALSCYGRWRRRAEPPKSLVGVLP